MWVRELNKIGVSTFALDGFTGRGLTEVNTNQALLGRLNFILDIFALSMCWRTIPASIRHASR